jgi:hypothetical protein
VAVSDQREVGRCCRKGHSSRGTPISYPGLAGRQLAAGFGGHVPAHRITAFVRRVRLLLQNRGQERHPACLTAAAGRCGGVGRAAYWGGGGPSALPGIRKRLHPPNVRARSDLRWKRPSRGFTMIWCKPGPGVSACRLTPRGFLGERLPLPRLQLIVGRATRQKQAVAPRLRALARGVTTTYRPVRADLPRGYLGEQRGCRVSSARRKIVRGWPCEVDAAPPGAGTAKRLYRGRPGSGRLREPAARSLSLLVRFAQRLARFR